jgi:hypothetical protein
MNIRERYNQIQAKYNSVIESKNGIYISLFCFIFFFFVSFWIENPFFKLPTFALTFFSWLNFLKQYQINKLKK